MAKTYTEDSVKDEKPGDIKIFPIVSYFTQLLTILKVRFIHRFRSNNKYIEFGLEILFFIFAVIFSVKSDSNSPDVKETEMKQSFPFYAIVGPNPRFGTIPNTTESREFAQTMNDIVSNYYSLNNLQILQDMQYFNNFKEYQDFVSGNRKIEDMFLAVEQINGEDGSQKYKISSNGIVDSFLPDYFQTISTSIIKSKTNQDLPIRLKYQPMPHMPVFTPDLFNGVNTAIFGFVFTISALLVTGTNYVEEAEKGIRDILTFYGLSNFISNVSWLIISFLSLFVPSIVFSIALSIALNCNFGVIFLIYLTGSFALSSFFLCILVLYPKSSFGMISSMSILLTFFIFIFLGYFAFLTEVGSDAAKNVLSLFPHACIGYALFMVSAGYVNDFETVATVKEYSVKYAYVYLLMEGIVYFLIYVLIDYFKDRKWLSSPSKWHYQEPLLNHEPIIVDHLSKQYGEVKAVNDLSFSLTIGDILAIVGPNGAGKTTLMSLICASKVPTEGHIKFQGVDISKNVKTMHRMTGYCPQDNIFLSLLTPEEWLRTICTLRGDKNYDFYPIISALGLEAQLNKRVGDMSGGNKRKVCLAAAIVCDPSIVILDEATSGVDFTSRTRIWSLISSLKNKTIIMATHTLEECEKIADKIMVLSHGHIDDYDTPTKLREKYKCGYTIDTELKYKEELSKLISQFSKENANSYEIKEDRVKFILPMDDSLHLSDVLQKINFPYLLNVQSLEEKIFEHVQEVEDSKGRGNDQSLQSVIDKVNKFDSIENNQNNLYLDDFVEP